MKKNTENIDPNNFWGSNIAMLEALFILAFVVVLGYSLPNKQRIIIDITFIIIFIIIMTKVFFLMLSNIKQQRDISHLL